MCKLLASTRLCRTAITLKSFPLADLLVLDRRYLIVAGACLTQFTVIGLLFSYGLFFKSLEAEFGWSRTLLSAASSLAFLMMGALAMLGGRLNDRFGPRLVLGVTGLLYGIGFMLVANISAAWQLFAIFGTFLALGLSTHDVVTLSTIARWFERKRGIMSGIIKVGTATGQVAVPPVAALLITVLGWRQALLVLGIMAAILLVLAASLMRAPPRPVGAATPTETGATFAEARRDRVFWTLCSMQFLFFTALMTIPLHLAIHGMDLGMSRASAATLLSAIGASSIVGRLTVGALVDKIGGKNAITLCFVFLLSSLIGFTLASAPCVLFVVVAIYGFAHGGLFTVVSPAVAEYFGVRAHGAIFGTILFFGTIGGAIGPILAGQIFDRTGSYQPAFITLAVFMTIAMLLVLTLPTSRGKLGS